MKTIIVILILAVVIAIILLMYLVTEHKAFVSKLKIGDKIKYNNREGTIVAMTHDSAVIKLKVPLMTLSELK